MVSGLCHTVQVNPGEVIHIFSDQEFEQILKNYPNQTIAIMASLTWCRPCIGFEKSYEVRLQVGCHCASCQVLGG